ncbi:hypothetical protein EBZ37_12650, partial [bacterium]|nr:hypothetical protein [bacterium]
MSDSAAPNTAVQRALFIVLSSVVGPSRLAAAAQGLKSHPVNEVLEVRSDSELQSGLVRLQEVRHGVVLFDVRSKPDLVRVSQFISGAQPLLRSGTVRMMGFLDESLSHSRILRFLKSRGGAEILPFRISEKSIRYKINRMASLIAASLATDRQQGLEGSARHVDWVSSLSIQSDYWIIRRTSDIKFGNNLWLVHLIGPPPVCGQWQRDLSLNSQGQDAWVFTLSKKYQHFGSEPGSWVFWGKLPRFSFETLMWTMISAAPRMVFIPKNGAERSVRISPLESSIRIAKNGVRSEAFRREIQIVLDAEKRFASESGSRRPDFAISMETQAGSGLERSRVEEEFAFLDLLDSEDPNPEKGHETEPGFVPESFEIDEFEGS